MMRPLVIILYVFALVFAGCQTRPDLLLKSKDLPTSETDEDLPWSDLGESTPDTDQQSVSTPRKSFPKGLKRDATLSSLAINYQIEKPKLLGAGVVGRKDDAVFYATTWDRLQRSEDRAYWDLVRVLSQRYGCLMRRRESLSNGYTFTCRDKRQVTLQFQRLGNDFLIVGRQKDRHGQDLFVQSH